MAIKASVGCSIVSMYMSKMNMIQIKRRGSTYLDTVKDKYDDKIIDVNEITSSESDDDTDVESSTITKDIIMFFGYGYSDQEYGYLSKQYADWATRYECKTKAQEELYKNICIAQLNVQKAQARGNTKEVNDAIKMFQDLLGAANLKPSQTNDNALVDQNTFGTLIKKWESQRPIAQPDEEWKDVDEINKYISTYFLGHLCNLVHIENDYEKQYREEMGKYTVTPPEYKEDELVETSLLDKHSNKGGNNNGK